MLEIIKETKEKSLEDKVVTTRPLRLINLTIIDWFKICLDLGLETPLNVNADPPG